MCKMHSFFLFRVNWMKWTRVCSNARLRKKEKSFVRRCARSLIHSIKWNRGHGQQRKIKHKFRNSIKMLFTEKWTAIKMYSVVFRENTLDIRMPPIPLAVVILSPPLPSRIIYTMHKHYNLCRMVHNEFDLAHCSIWPPINWCSI